MTKKNKNKKQTGPKNGCPGQTHEKGVAESAGHPDGRITIKISEIVSVYGISAIPTECFQRIGITNATLDTEVMVSQVRQAYTQRERTRAKARKEAKKGNNSTSDSMLWEFYPGNRFMPERGTYGRSDMDDVADLMQNMRLHGRTEDRSLIGPGRALVHYDSDY